MIEIDQTFESTLPVLTKRDKKCFNIKLHADYQADGTYKLTGTLSPLAKPTTPDPKVIDDDYDDDDDIVIEPELPTPVVTTSFTMDDLGHHRVDYPALAFARSEFHLFYVGMDVFGRKRLYHKNLTTNSSSSMLREDVVHVQAETAGNGRVQLAIITNAGGRFNFFTGETRDNRVWSFTQGTPNTGRYSLGDVSGTPTVGPMFIKGDEFVRMNGEVVDYARHWFLGGVEQEFHLPIAPSGQRYEVYTVATEYVPVEDLGDFYVGLLGLFHIEDEKRTASQHGPIFPVWAYSKVGSDRWHLPFGDEPAFGNRENMVLPCTFMKWGSQFRLSYEVTSFSHNTWNKSRSKETSIHLAKFGFDEVIDSVLRE